MKIVVTPRGFAKCGLDNAKIIEDAGFLLEYNNTGNAYTKEEFYQKTMDADGVIVGVETVDRAYIDAHPQLKAVVKFGVGTDNIDVDYCRQKGIFVGRTAGSNSQSVAETAISFVLADSKNLYESIAGTRAQGWSKLTGYEIAGKVIGIAGFGAIGKKVARMAFGLGMKVLAYDPYSIDPEAVKRYDVEIVEFEELLKRSDFVSLHIPLTPETRDLVSMRELKMMKSTAVLINTARGGIVNEEDLWQALQDKTIRSAYFDVLSHEPPRQDEPLLTLPNFYLTPHIASRSKEAEKNTADMATQIIIQALKQKA
jgi:phosphoglycerate dehydrogenase-like enzyme